MNDVGEVAGDPTVLRGSARALSDVAGELFDACTRATAAAGAATAEWTGPRSVDARFAAHGVTGQLAVAARAVGAVAEALGALATALERAQDEVAQANADVRRVDASASIDPHALDRAHALAAERADAARTAYQRAAEVFASRVEEVARRAVHVSSAADLDALGVRRVPTAAVVAAAWRVLDGWVQPDCAVNPTAAALAHGVTGSPAHVAAWWRGLPPLAQATLLRGVPELLGNLDGLPGWVRDLANRQQLATLRADVSAQVDRFLDDRRVYADPRARPGQLPAALAEHLHALDALVVVLARPGRQLLTLDVTSGRRVRAAVGVGDVDTADDVAVFTPGFTSSVGSSMDDYVGKMADLRTEADMLAQTDGRHSATIAWLGYDAPQWGDTPDPIHTVLHSYTARAGSVALAGFLTGVDASRSGHVHMVALGHSYGSTTTGFALARRRTGVDDAVLFGSPGYGTLTSHALKVPAGHLYDVDAPGDPVGGTPLFGGNPALSPSFHHLSPWGSPVGRGSYGHVAYLDPGTTSQWNIAAVLARHPEQTVAAPFLIPPIGMPLPMADWAVNPRSPAVPAGAGTW